MHETEPVRSQEVERQLGGKIVVGARLTDVSPGGLPALLDERRSVEHSGDLVVRSPEFGL